MPVRDYEGGCHCGAVRFRVRVRRHVALDCNCSICRKKGNLHLIVDASDFELLAGADSLRCYEFNTGVAKHRFCERCGIHPFYTPRSHPDGVDVNIRCLDAAGPADFEIRTFDGANWETNVDQIQPGPQAR
jgi:hypothetical protein